MLVRGSWVCFRPGLIGVVSSLTACSVELMLLATGTTAPVPLLLGDCAACSSALICLPRVEMFTSTPSVLTRLRSIDCRTEVVPFNESSVSISELVIVPSMPDVSIRRFDVSVSELSTVARLDSTRPVAPLMAVREPRIAPPCPGTFLSDLSIAARLPLMTRTYSGSGSASVLTSTNVASVSPSALSIELRALVMPDRNPMTTTTTRIRIVAKIHVHLVSDARRGIGTSGMIRRSSWRRGSWLSLAGVGRLVRPRQLLVDAAGRVEDPVGHDEDVPRVHLDRLCDAQRLGQARSDLVGVAVDGARDAEDACAGAGGRVDRPGRRLA